MGFFKALFDFSFSSFITTKIIKFLYVVMVILTALGCIFVIISSIASSRGSAAWLLVLLISPIAFILYVILFRMGFEMTIVLFQIAENIRDMSWAITKGAKSPVAGGLPPAPSYPPQYGYPPQPPQQPQYPQYPQYPQQPPQQPQNPSGGYGG
jgi:hypothetical protein